jgi:hypothetical protein
MMISTGAVEALQLPIGRRGSAHSIVDMPRTLGRHLVSNAGIDMLVAWNCAWIAIWRRV